MTAPRRVFTRDSVLCQVSLERESSQRRIERRGERRREKERREGRREREKKGRIEGEEDQRRREGERGRREERRRRKRKRTDCRFCKTSADCDFSCSSRSAFTSAIYLSSCCSVRPSTRPLESRKVAWTRSDAETVRKEEQGGERKSLSRALSSLLHPLSLHLSSPFFFSIAVSPKRA